MVIYRSIYEAMKKAKTAELRSKIIMAIMAYGFDGEEYTDDDPMVSIVFDLIKPQIDANNRRYENGKRGGRPKKADQKPNETQENPENQVGYFGNDEKPNQNQTITKTKPNNNQTITKVEPNVHVHEHVHDNDNVNDNIPPSNTLYYCPPKGETDTAANGDSEVKTDSVDSDSEEKKKVPRKKKRTELPDGTFEYIPVGQIAEYMKSNTVWFEAFCMNKHLDPEFVKRKIDEFAAHCADNGETEKDKRDCIRHFNNWLRIRQDRPPERCKMTTRAKHPATDYNNDQRFEIF